MRYYSMQNLEAWDYAQRVGFLTGNVDYIEPSWREPYAWLVAQMRTRLGIDCPFWPVWMWDTRPDLRESCWRSDQAQVLLALDVNPLMVLASDYSSWHAPLNDWELLRHPEEVIDKEKSWERIFDFELLRSDFTWFGTLRPQYTAPRVPVERIKVLHKLAARPKRA
jgi:hypothetical protein